ncbi:MAG: hypothetical protein BWY99_02390 [Synergistetes bacterium ADurb.BinA166]|nr:MAG: hypothetical protein BWY99_02390 [Synergistetes bacterium ADurb.BinA166]
MTLVIQAVTIAGEILEGARWPSGLMWVQEGQSLTLSAPVKDRDLLEYVRRQASRDCLVDRDGKSHTVSMACRVEKVRHMVSTDSGATETLVTVCPINRFVEGVLTYALKPSMCDPRFAAAVRREPGPEVKKPRGRPAS